MPKTLLALFLSVCLPYPLRAGTLFERTQVLMGNVPVVLVVSAQTSKRDEAFQAMEEAYVEARRIENEVSEWRPESQTSLLNRNAGKALVPIGRDLMTILTKAREISELTDGAFDVTFSSKKKTASYRDVVVLPELGLAYLPAGVKIGVSGIAKGYIVDRMSELLRRTGFRRFLVNAGDIYAAGRWTIGIRDPSHPGGGQATCTVTVKDQAISTSGNYERGAHIVDPHTRRPVVRPGGVTVVARQSMTADAWATALFMLGDQKGREGCFIKQVTNNSPPL